MTNDDFKDLNKTCNNTKYFTVLNTENHIRVETNTTGKMFATVVAVNNALQSSKPACSDGITRDINPPLIQNISVEFAKWSESIFCLKGRAWHFNSEFQKRLLRDNVSCKNRCPTDTGDSELIDVIQEIQPQNDIHSPDEFLCKHLPLFNTNLKLYLPNDHLSLKWSLAKGLSQVENFFVGFGKTVDEKYSPSLQAYKSTNGHPYIKINHLGVGSDNEFYIFIKVENKANLEKIVSVGPIVIDETPPLYIKKPSVSIKDQDIIITWEENQFYDNEQTEEIGQILFQIGTAFFMPPLLGG